MSSIANLGYFDQVQLSTTESYTQITNTKNGIAFDGNYSVFICDYCGNEMEDITLKVDIIQFIDNNGIPQLYFTINPLLKDYNKQAVTLRFKHTVSNYVWYSNLITISDYRLDKTSRFDYKAYSDFHGIAYNRANIYQSIRLACYFTVNDSESQSVEYTSSNGIKVTSRLIETEFEKYIFERIDNFTYRRLNKLLSHPLIYLNDNRVTDKQTLKSKDNYGSTNNMGLDFKVAINYNETLSRITYLLENPADFDSNDFDNLDFMTG